MGKRSLIKIHWFLSSQLGFDPVRFAYGVLRFPAFILGLLRFRSVYRGRLNLAPCLHDKSSQSGATGSEYFWQDLTVARMIQNANPNIHVDVGSRVDGFVSHVASFRAVEVFDIRPNVVTIPGVAFIEADVMNQNALPNQGLSPYCDSLSCLHALEHFGLGRYGDKFDPLGYVKGFENMSRLLQYGGKFYLSVPVGRERVEFNANWVFSPYTIINLGKQHGLTLINLFLIHPNAEPEEISGNETSFSALNTSHYKLCLFIFQKLL